MLKNRQQNSQQKKKKSQTIIHKARNRKRISLKPHSQLRCPQHCLIVGLMVASTPFRNFTEVIVNAHYGNIFHVSSRIPALSTGQPSNSGTQYHVVIPTINWLIDWCLARTPEIFQLDRGCLHKNGGALETWHPVIIRIPTLNERVRPGVMFRERHRSCGDTHDQVEIFPEFALSTNQSINL
jgi:hypothetical protein